MPLQNPGGPPGDLPPSDLPPDNLPPMEEPLNPDTGPDPMPDPGPGSPHDPQPRQPDALLLSPPGREDRHA